MGDASDRTDEHVRPAPQTLGTPYPIDLTEASSSPHPGGPPAKLEFTPQARETLSRLIDQHVEDLTTYSIARARRAGADVVSAQHVEQTAESLGERPGRRRARKIGLLAAAPLGAGLGGVANMVGSNEYSALSVLLNFGLVFAGAWGTAHQLARE